MTRESQQGGGDKLKNKQQQQNSPAQHARQLTD